MPSMGKQRNQAATDVRKRAEGFEVGNSCIHNISGDQGFDEIVQTALLRFPAGEGCANLTAAFFNICNHETDRTVDAEISAISRTVPSRMPIAPSSRGMMPPDAVEIDKQVVRTVTDQCASF